MDSIIINIKEINSPIIYIIRNLNNDKVYIGSSKNGIKRANEHKNDLIKGIHHNKHLQRSYNKGNKFSIEILEQVSEDNKIEREKYYCILFNSYDKRKGYNMVEPQKLPIRKLTRKEIENLINARRKAGYNTSHLRSKEVIEKQVKRKYKKIEIFNLEGNLLEIAESMIDGERITGVKRQNISQICRGVKKQCKGFKFKIKA